MQPSQLRPMHIGDLLDTAFRLYRAHLGHLLMLTAFVLLPMTLVRLLLLATPSAAQLLDIVQSIFLVPLLCGALTITSARIYSNQTIASGQAFRAGARRYLSILGAAFLEGIVIGVPAAVVGGLLFVLLARSSASVIVWALLAILLLPCIVFLATRYTVMFPAIMIEGVGASTGLRRSWALTKGKFWHTAGVWFASSLLTILLSQLPAFCVAYLAAMIAPGTALAWLTTLQIGLVQLGLLITLPFQYLVPVVLYYDLRIRNEGYDLEQAVNAAGVPSM